VPLSFGSRDLRTQCPPRLYDSDLAELADLTLLPFPPELGLTTTRMVRLVGRHQRGRPFNVVLLQLFFEQPQIHVPGLQCRGFRLAVSVQLLPTLPDLVVSLALARSI
jgi:hypothetical protein